MAILRIRSTLIKAIRDYFDSKGFTLVDTPIFTPASCEGTTTLFETQYFFGLAAHTYDIHPDGQRFLMIRDDPGTSARPQIVLVQNWFDELKRLVPIP